MTVLYAAHRNVAQSVVQKTIMNKEPDCAFVVSWRLPDGHVQSKAVPDTCSMLLTFQHAMTYHKSVWVREDPGGAIILVYDAYGNLLRPSWYRE